MVLSANCMRSTDLFMPTNKIEIWRILKSRSVCHSSLICYQNGESADADVGIDDVAEYAVGNEFENVGTQHRADNDTAKTIEIVNGYGGCEEAVVGSYARHHQIANQEISLRHRHVMFLRRLTLDEVQHGGRALHAKETAHQSAQCSCADLHFLCRRQFYASAK